MDKTAAETLAQHFSKLSYDEIPKKQIDDARTLLLDYPRRRARAGSVSGKRQGRGGVRQADRRCWRRRN